MGKKRKTAKTGDKKLYKGRELTVSTTKKGDDDKMYNEIDRYHNEKDEEYISLVHAPEEHVDDDGYADKEAVLDLAGGVSSSEEEDDGDSDNDENDIENHEVSDEEAHAMSSDDDDDDDDQMEEEGVMDWGRKKSSYFGGDTADLEIGQNEEDAYLEEEAAKEVLNARYENMDEDDFMLSDYDDHQEKPSNIKEIEEIQNSRDLKKLSRGAKRKLLQSHHPELIPLVTHFSRVIHDWNVRTRVVSEALFSSKDVSPQDVGATSEGLEYLLTKSMIQASSALNVAAYLLLKAEQAAKEKDSDDFLLDDEAGFEIKSHPVISRLQQLNKLSMQLEDMVECKIVDMPHQIDNLVKAAALMKAEPADGNDDYKDDPSSEDPDLSSEDDMDEPRRKVLSQSVPHEESDDDSNEQDFAQSVLNEARFGLRPKEVTAKTSLNGRRPAPSDFGDEEVDEAKSRKTSQSLASTINTIKQRASTKTRKSDQHDEDLDKQGGDDDRVRRGLAMMEADLGQLDDDEEDDGGDDNSVDDEIDDDLGVDKFYDQVKLKSQMKKAFKKQLHTVAPKYPVMEEVVAGERAISKTILKNRGMSAHKAKINRNPRVKKREQYRKALIRRKGAIREVRTQEGHKYGGEGTGIKTGLSRSRKLGGPA